MKKNILIRGILFLVVVALLTIGLTGCEPVIPIPCITGTLNIDINDNYTYRVYIDEVLWGTSDWNGDITLDNVPLGYHTIYVQSTEIPYYCAGNADTTINCGLNNLFITVFCII
jgi:hypothetical protein